MKIKVKYNSENNQILGYYPEKENYLNNDIDEKNKTIDGFPYIEIDSFEQELDKNMIVEKGIYKELLKSKEEILEELKELKLKELKNKIKDFIYLPIDYLGTKFINSEVSWNNLQAVYAFMDEPIEWLDLMGNPIILTKLELKGLISLILGKRKIGYFLEAQYKKQINDCTTIQELDNLVFSFE